MPVEFTPMSDAEAKTFQDWLRYRSLESRLCALAASHTASISRARSVRDATLSSLRASESKATPKRRLKLQEREALIRAWAAYREATAFRALAKLPAAVAFARFGITTNVKKIRAVLL